MPGALPCNLRDCEKFKLRTPNPEPKTTYFTNSFIV
jgi:hypothetical protein